MAVRPVERVSSRQWRTKSGSLFDSSNVINLSLLLNVLLSITCLVFAYSNFYRTEETTIKASAQSITPLKWNGGHPLDEKAGSCFCSGVDSYCMCTPSLAIDLVIVTENDHIWLVRRKDTNQLATMGGFVMVGETVEHAVRRELKEETGIVWTKPPTLIGVYSDPRRDNRRHTTSAVYAIHLDGKENPVAADDVKEVKRIPMVDIEQYEYFADHRTILLDYRKWHLQREKEKKELVISSQLKGYKGDVAPNIERSICG